GSNARPGGRATAPARPRPPGWAGRRGGRLRRREAVSRQRRDARRRLDGGRRADRSRRRSGPSGSALARAVGPRQDRPPLETPPEAPLVQTFRSAATRVRGTEAAIRGVSYYTDASVLAYPTDRHRVGAGPLPTVIFGPGDEQLCHQPNERIEVAQVLT